ncbi:unnamed protein product [Phaeothamnion confervicola]
MAQCHARARLRGCLSQLKAIRLLALNHGTVPAESEAAAAATAVAAAAAAAAGSRGSRPSRFARTRCILRWGRFSSLWASRGRREDRGDALLPRGGNLPGFNTLIGCGGDSDGGNDKVAIATERREAAAGVITRLTSWTHYTSDAKTTREELEETAQRIFAVYDAVAGSWASEAVRATNERMAGIGLAWVAQSLIRFFRQHLTQRMAALRIQVAKSDRGRGGMCTQGCGYSGAASNGACCRGHSRAWNWFMPAGFQTMLDFRRGPWHTAVPTEVTVPTAEEAFGEANCIDETGSLTLRWKVTTIRGRRGGNRWQAGRPASPSRSCATACSPFWTMKPWRTFSYRRQRRRSRSTRSGCGWCGRARRPT